MAGSGSAHFDVLKKHMDENSIVRREVEFAFSALLSAANPSDRGLRFLFGNGAEWILAAAAWTAGVLTAPAGHNVDGFDLGDLMDKNRALWSVKASASKKGGQIRLINFMGDGSKRKWTEPTIFVGPYYGGAVFIDPLADPEVQDRARHGTDALILPGGVPKQYAKENPQNYIKFNVAVNERGESGDPYTFIKSVLDPAHFPNLSRPFIASEPSVRSNLVSDITRLADQRNMGSLTEEQFQKAINKVLDQ